MNRLKQTVLLILGFLLMETTHAAVNTTTGSGNWGDAIWSAGVPASDDDVTIQTGHTVTITDTNTHYVGSLTIQSNAVLTHSANGATVLYKIILNVATNLIIDAGGKIDITGKGYPAMQGLGYSTDQRPGSYGGTGYGQAAPTYGSVTAPVDMGSGGRHGPGGGILRLHVTGNFVLDGTIESHGQAVETTSNPGAGGSVYITAGGISGSGTNSVSGGITSANGSGGGRITVILTNSADWGNVVMQAYGGGVGSSQGGAGTVYLKDTNSPYGRLIIDNNSGTTAEKCLISSLVTDREVGDVDLRNGGKFQIASNQALSVYGNWINGASFVAGSGSTLFLAGTNAATIYGDSTFDHLECTTPGKTVYFEAGRTNQMAGGLSLASTNGNLIVLRSTVTDSLWYFTLQPGKEQSVSYVNVRDSNASGGDAILAGDSSNVANNVNWNFDGPVIVTWMGTTDTDWANTNNWDLLRLPNYIDTVVIQDTANDPVLDVDREIAVLTVQTDAVLYLSGKNLTVNGDVLCPGNITASGSETITLKGNVNLTDGTFTQAASQIIIGGTATQSVTLVANSVYDLLINNASAAVSMEDSFTAHDIEISGTTAALVLKGAITLNDLLVNNPSGTVNFQSGLTANDITINGNTDTLTFGAAISARDIVITNTSNTVELQSVAARILRCEATGPTLKFQAGQDFTLTNLLLRGESASPILLRSSSDSSQWKLNVFGWHGVRYVDVRDSDATGGNKIYAIDSVDSTSNTNWDFGTWYVWNGTASSVFLDNGNWTNGTAPGSGDAVLIDGNGANAPKIAVETSVRKLLLGPGAVSQLTVNTNFTVVEDMLVCSYGTVTHDYPGAAGNSVTLTIGGNLTVDTGGKIDVTGKGYPALQGPGYSTDQRPGSHGGRGFGQAAGTYGAVVTPVTHGSGGRHGPGGGVVTLSVVGTTRIDGVIRSHGKAVETTSNPGAGGSIRISSGQLCGEGDIDADGGTTTGNGSGGGRIAVILGNGTDTGDVSIHAFGGRAGSVNVGGAGTVYLKFAGERAGRVFIDNGNPASAATTDFPPTTNGVPQELANATLIITNTTAVGLVGDEWVGNILIYTNASMTLSSYYLHVDSIEHSLEDLTDKHPDASTNRVDYYEQILWEGDPAGTIFMIR